MSGYWKKLLKIDLTEGEVKEEELSDEFLRKYIGGAGFTTKIIFDELEPDIDPLDPENVLAVAPGTLVGPTIPTASKTTFGFKAPQTGGYGKSVVGAKMGDQLKKAGFDALTIKGKAENPSMIVIEDDKVSIEEADHLWGLDTRDTDERIKEEYEDFATAVIGPAGENLSKISEIECEDRQAGKGGGGAVMGSKNLKAISVKGSKDLPISDQEKLDELNSKWRKITTGQGETADESFDPQDQMDYGTGEAMAAKNQVYGCFPTKNWQAGYFKRAYDNLEDPDDRIELNPRYWTEVYRDGRRPCPYCTKPCSQYFKAEDTPYGDIAVDGPEYETQYSLGGACEVDDIEAVAKANEICDTLGLDTISAGLTISWAMEANEKGLIDPDLDLEFGNAEAMLEALKKIAHKEGELGELLGDGVYEAAMKVGQGSEKFAIHVKGMPPAGFEVRGIKGMALAFAVAPRGADHLTSCLYALEMAGDYWDFEDYDRTKLTGKAFALKSMEDLMTLYDMTGMCKFSRGLMVDEGQLELLNAVTGFDMSLSEFLKAGERVYNLSKAFNIRNGFGRKDDKLPDRVFDDEVLYGPTEGETLSRKEFEEELDRYYDVRGWDNEGIPSKNTLKRLDLPQVAEEIGSVKEKK
ncbi:MAG: aldehyde ferredoxin oxidoreductase family protein [Candidatus Thermoplasmatota archaeon]|nr:aldehyde ferredoxin oxidoreductase family protein [Candidatus Thermoplasmatota archaeon]